MTVYWTSGTGANGSFSHIISKDPSKTTNSFYLIFTTTNDEVYSFAISDHITLGHDSELDEEFDSDNPNNQLNEDDLTDLIGLVNNWMGEVDSTFNPDDIDWEDFGFEKARYYHSDYCSNRGRYVTERAFVADEISNTVQVKDTYLTHHKQVLNIVYQDPQDEHEDTERYINHVPDFGDVLDAATISYLTQCPYLDIHDARKLFYSNGYSWNLLDKDEFLDEDDIINEIEDDEDIPGTVDTIRGWSLERILRMLNIDNFEIYDYQGQQYIADVDDYNQQLDNNGIDG